MTPDDLHALIESGDAAVTAALPAATLGVDRHGRTAFDVALACGFDAVLDALAANKQAHALAAMPRDDLLMPIKHTVAQTDTTRHLEKTESSLRATFGHDLAFGRTPLLQACRHVRLDIAEALLANGAKPGKKDLLGLDEADLCLAAGGSAALLGFMQACARHKRKPMLSENIVARLLRDPTTLAAATQGANLSAAAKRLLLAYHCARLDLPAVQRLLDDGLDPNKAVHEFANPVYEACTSRLLWLEELPGWLPLAWSYACHAGPSGSQVNTFDTESAISVAEQMRLAREAMREKQARIDALTLDENALAEQTAQRLQVIDLLLGAGIDPSLVRKKAPAFFIHDLLLQEQPALLSGLLARGFDLTPDEHERDMIDARHLALLEALSQGAATPVPAADLFAPPNAGASWELPAETTLRAIIEAAPAGAELPFVARINLCNSYGPILECKLFLRDAGNDTGTWQAMTLREEHVYGDDGMRPYHPGDTLSFGEMPWSATFERPWPRMPGHLPIEIRLQSSADYLNLVIRDWTGSGD